MTFKGDIKLLQTITKEFIERFNALNNIIADVYIKHILYGSQRIKECVLHPFVGEDRIGFIINEEEIYITIEELSGVSLDSDQCIIESEVMELYINLL
jgi:tetrahydromethanopterin S-methyltransferase subunit A